MDEGGGIDLRTSLPAAGRDQRFVILEDWEIV
jgi:hypothetical protein